MHIFARCGQANTLTLAVPANGSFADVRAALLRKQPKLMACSDLVSEFTLCVPALHTLCACPCAGGFELTLFTTAVQCFTYGGRVCEDGASLAASGVQRDSTVDVQRRLRGGGGDGGATGAESRSSYLEMYMAKKPDKVSAVMLT